MGFQPEEQLTSYIPKAACKPSLRKELDRVVRGLGIKRSEFIRWAVEQAVKEAKDCEGNGRHG